MDDQSVLRKAGIFHRKAMLQDGEEIINSIATRMDDEKKQMTQAIANIIMNQRMNFDSDCNNKFLGDPFQRYGKYILEILKQIEDRLKPIWVN